MSKARSMYAGSSGSNYGVNKNSRGNGNGKWQGLPPTVGHARNARHINIEAGGNNRNVVFCMNQLGGVGRISNMFATTADGVKDCGCILPSNIKNALQQLSNYASQQGLLLGLAGVNETVQSDLPKTSGLTPFNTSFPPEMQQYVSLINGLGLKFQVTTPIDIQLHVVVMLTKADADALKAGGYGVPTLCDNIIAYGKTCPILSSKVENGKLILYLVYPDSSDLIPTKPRKSYNRGGFPLWDVEYDADGVDNNWTLTIGTILSSSNPNSPFNVGAGKNKVKVSSAPPIDASADYWYEIGEFSFQGYNKSDGPNTSGEMDLLAISDKEWRGKEPAMSAEDRRLIVLPPSAWNYKLEIDLGEIGNLIALPFPEQELVANIWSCSENSTLSSCKRYVLKDKGLSKCNDWNDVYKQWKNSEN